MSVGYDRTGFTGELAGFLSAVTTSTPFTPGLEDLLPAYRVMDELRVQEVTDR